MPHVWVSSTNPPIKTSRRLRVSIWDAHIYIITQSAIGIKIDRTFLVFVSCANQAWNKSQFVRNGSRYYQWWTCAIDEVICYSFSLGTFQIMPTCAILLLVIYTPNQLYLNTFPLLHVVSLGIVYNEIQYGTHIATSAHWTY